VCEPCGNTRAKEGGVGDDLGLRRWLTGACVQAWGRADDGEHGHGGEGRMTARYGHDQAQAQGEADRAMGPASGRAGEARRGGGTWQRLGRSGCQVKSGSASRKNSFSSKLEVAASAMTPSVIRPMPERWDGVAWVRTAWGGGWQLGWMGWHDGDGDGVGWGGMGWQLG
jgi:hypothetical protein